MELTQKNSFLYQMNMKTINVDTNLIFYPNHQPPLTPATKLQ